MSTREIKAQRGTGSETITHGAQIAADMLGNGAEAIGAKVDVAEEQLRVLGRRLRDRAKDLSEQAAEQARLHPLATVGLAVAAGILIARLVRR